MQLANYLLILFLLSGCDWVNGASVGGDYVLESSDEDHRYIFKRGDGTNQVVIDQQIVGTRTSGKFVLVHRMVAVSYECHDVEGERTIVTHYTDQEEYWIIDLPNESLDGPFTYQEYREKTRTLKIPDATIKDDLEYRSNGDSFRARTAGCKRLEQI